MENKNLDQILMGWEGVGGTKLRKKDGNGEECDFSDKCFKVSWGKKNLLLVSGSSGLETLCAILSFVDSQIQELGLGLASFSRSLFSPLSPPPPLLLPLPSLLLTQALI